jgi:hypothetical protein
LGYFTLCAVATTQLTPCQQMGKSWGSETLNKKTNTRVDKCRVTNFWKLLLLFENQMMKINWRKKFL